MSANSEVKRVVPKTPGGFPEYLPKDQILFNQMLAIIKSVYERFGFLPLETPAVEFTEVLLAKGGGETDKQVYRLFAAGDEKDQFIDTGKSLHFDLTVPLARYVAQRYNDLIFPFRRHQLQKVWRGEGPQKGRFREFYQCDIDVIGTTNPLVDAEIPSVINTVFEELKLPPFVIGVNNRKILNGIFVSFGASQKSSRDALVLLDKVDKIGQQTVEIGLRDLNFTPEQATKLMEIMALNGQPGEIFNKLKLMGIDNNLFTEGLNHLELVFSAMKAFAIPQDNYRLDLSIARGLDYYTGTVYETRLKDYPQVGSICSGGRYDNLCEYYIDKNLPGVGISIGLSRLFSQLKEINFFQTEVEPITRLMIAIADDSARQYAMAMASRFRQTGVNTEIFWEDQRLGKKLKYAERLGIPYVAIIGGNEVENKTLTLKTMATHIQSSVDFKQALQIITTQLH